MVATDDDDDAQTNERTNREINEPNEHLTANTCFGKTAKCFRYLSVVIVQREHFCCFSVLLVLLFFLLRFGVCNPFGKAKLKHCLQLNLGVVCVLVFARRAQTSSIYIEF